MRKYLSKLDLVREIDLNYDASRGGSTTMSITSLTVDTHRERDQEERARAMTNNTTVADCRKSKKNILVLDLTFKSARTFLKY